MLGAQIKDNIYITKSNVSNKVFWIRLRINHSARMISFHISYYSTVKAGSI
jgi:hypothetical protein